MSTQIYNLNEKGFISFPYSIFDSNTGDIYTLACKTSSTSSLSLFLLKYNEKKNDYTSSDVLIINSLEYFWIPKNKYFSSFEINDVKILGNYIHVCLGGYLFNNGIESNYLTIISINTTDMTQKVVYNKFFDYDNSTQKSIIGCMKIEPVLGGLSGIYILNKNKLYYVDFTYIDSNGYYDGTENIIANNLYLSSDKKYISCVKLIGNYIYYVELETNLKKISIVNRNVDVIFTLDKKKKPDFISHKIYTDSQGYIYLKPSNQGGNLQCDYWTSSRKYCYILSKDDKLLTKFIINDKYFYSNTLDNKTFTYVTFIDGLIDNKNYCVLNYKKIFDSSNSYTGIYKFKSPLSTYSIMVKDSNKIYLNGYLTKNKTTFMVEGIYDYSSPNNNLLNNQWQTTTIVGVFPSEPIIYDYLENVITSDTDENKPIELCSIAPKGIGLDSLPLFGSDNNRYCIAPITLNGLRNYYKQYYLHYMPNTTNNIASNEYNTLANVSVDIRPYPIKNILFKNVQIKNFNGYYILADATKFDTSGNKVYDIVGLYDKTQFSVNLLRPDEFPFNTTSNFLNDNISYSFDSNGLPINSYTSTIANLLDLSNNHIYPIYSDLSGVIQDTYYGYNTSSIDSLSLTDTITLGQTITEQIAKANFTKWYHFKLTTGGFFGSQVYIVYELFFNVTDIDSNGIGNIGVLYQNIAPFNDLLNDNLILYKEEGISQSRKFNTSTLLMSNVNISSSVTSILGFNIINTQTSIAHDCTFYNSNGSFIFSEKTVENTYDEKFSSSFNLLNYNRTNGLYIEEMKWKNLNVNTTSGEFKGYFCYGTNSGDVFQVRDYNESTTTPTNLLVRGTGGINLQTSNHDFSSTGITVTGLGTSSNSLIWTISKPTSV